MSSTLPTHKPTLLLQPPPSDLVAPSLEEMQKKIHDHAEANGYKVIIRSTDLPSIRYTCHRSGKPSGQPSSRSRKTDCPFAFTISEVVAPNLPIELQNFVLDQNHSGPPVGSWTIRIKHPGHNHEPLNPSVGCLYFLTTISHKLIGMTFPRRPRKRPSRTLRVQPPSSKDH